MPARNQDGLRCYNSTEAVFDTVDEPDCAPPRRSHGWWYLGAKHEDNFEDVRQRFGTLLGVNFSDTFDPNKTICTPRFGPDDYILGATNPATGYYCQSLYRGSVIVYRRRADGGYEVHAKAADLPVYYNAVQKAVYIDMP